MSNGIDHTALKIFLLTTTFRVVQEDAGVPFLLGKLITVEEQSGRNPTLAVTYCITPSGVSPKDLRFNRLFERLKPAVLKITKTGEITCGSGIIAHPEKEADISGSVFGTGGEGKNPVDEQTGTARPDHEVPSANVSEDASGDVPLPDSDS